MERFLDTPFEEFPVDLITVRKAAEKMSLPGQSPSRYARYEPYPQRRSYTRSIGSSCGSADSASAPSFWSYDSRPSRKGRRKIVFDRDAFEAHSPTDDKFFYCTFCPKRFSGRYEWNRHEEAVHVPTKLWICRADEYRHHWVIPSQCLYCEEINPSSQHLEQHKLSRCQRHPESERTFLRKDHLMQHLLSFHGCSKDALAISMIESCQQDQASIEPSHPSLHCGFCGYHAPAWDDRVEHVASHFKSKIDLLEWWLQRKMHFQRPLASQLFVPSICSINSPLT
jgi:hypothetical protein